MALALTMVGGAGDADALAVGLAAGLLDEPGERLGVGAALDPGALVRGAAVGAAVPRSVGRPSWPVGALPEHDTSARPMVNTISVRARISLERA